MNLKIDQQILDEKLIDACIDDDVDLELIKSLIQKGADIHVDCDFPVRILCLNGSIEAVKILIEHGADLTQNNHDSLQCAASSGNIELVKLVLKYDKTVTLNTISDMRGSQTEEMLKLFEPHLDRPMFQKAMDNVFDMRNNISHKCIERLIKLGFMPSKTSMSKALIDGTWSRMEEFFFKDNKFER